MNKNSVYSFVVAASSAALIFGCAKVPEQELSAAKASLDSARVAEADKYMALDYVAAQDSLTAALAEIEKQKSANPVTRSYDRAKALLASVSTLAGNARAKAGEEKQKVQADVDMLLKNSTALISETRELLAKAPKGKEGKAALEAMGTEISAVESALGDVQTMKASGDLIGARDKAGASVAKLDSIKVELTTAIEKSSAKSNKK